MSAFNQFLEKAKQDQDLHYKLQGVKKLSELVNLGSEYNFQFTIADVKKKYQDMFDSGELSEEDLRKISGGTVVNFVSSVHIC